MDSLVSTLNSISPIVFCLLIGKAMTRTALFRDIHWPSLEKIMFWVFLPPLIFRAIVRGDFAIGDSLKLAAVLVAAQTLMAVGALLHARIFALPAASMTSLFQNAVRWNNIIPIALAATLYGDAGMNLVAVALAVMVPLANVSCIVVLEYTLNRAVSSWWVKLRAVLKNPLIIACLAGLAVKLTGLTLPAAMMSGLDILGSATLGAGLLVVGASISFGAMSRDRLHLALATAMKTLGMPLITLGLCIAAGINGLPLVIAVLCTAAPTAMQGYIVARNMGGDTELMSSVITAGHLVAVVTIPLMLMLAARV